MLDLQNESTNKILKKYVEDQSFYQNLKKRQNEINFLANEKLQLEISRLQKNKTEVLKKKNNLYYELYRFLKLYNTRNILIPPKAKEGYEFEKIAYLMKYFVKKNDSKLFFIYLPEYNRYYLQDYKNENYKKVKNIIEKLDIPFIDINSEVFLKENNPLDLFPFGLRGNHYTKEGYNKVGKFIANFIEKN